MDAFKKAMFKNALLALATGGLLFSGSPLMAQSYRAVFPMDGLMVAYEAPEGVGSLHPNGVTITCVGMADGDTFDIAGTTYQVVYTQADARTVAATACTSNMTTLTDIFLNMSSFNEDISHWDVSRVISFENAFYGNTAFNQDIGQWDTSSATNMAFMFYRAQNFNQDISGWSVGSVTDMGSMFNNAYVFNQDLTGWCVSQIPSLPSGFNASTFAWSSLKHPDWGTCP